MAATASAPMTATHTIRTFCTSGDSVASDCCRSSARCSASSSDSFRRSRAADALLRVVECVGGGEEVEVSAAITRSERRACGGAARGARVRGTHDAGVARAVLTPPTREKGQQPTASRLKEGGCVYTPSLSVLRLLLPPHFDRCCGRRLGACQVSPAPRSTEPPRTAAQRDNIRFTEITVPGRRVFLVFDSTNT